MLKSRVIYCPFSGHKPHFHFGACVTGSKVSLLQSCFFLGQVHFRSWQLHPKLLRGSRVRLKSQCIGCIRETSWCMLMDGCCWIYQRRHHVDHLQLELSQGFIRIRAVHGCEQQSTVIAGWWLLYKLQFRWLFPETHLQLGGITVDLLFTSSSR